MPGMDVAVIVILIGCTGVAVTILRRDLNRDMWLIGWLVTENRWLASRVRRLERELGLQVAADRPEPAPAPTLWTRIRAAARWLSDAVTPTPADPDEPTSPPAVTGEPSPEAPEPDPAPDGPSSTTPMRLAWDTSHEELLTAAAAAPPARDAADERLAQFSFAKGHDRGSGR